LAVPLPKKARKTRLWHFDPSVFQPGPKAGFFERQLSSPARALGRHALYGLAFSYPLFLVTIGVLFGGIVFWPTLVGSVGLIYLIITKTGYAANFASWDVGNKKFIGLVGGFGMALALVYGLIYLSLWIVPIFGLSLVIALVLGVRIVSNR
jgi:hypothetical protein